MLSSRGRGMAIVFALGGCTTVANERVDDPATSLDETVFRCSVEPILARQCSYTACHGNAGTPLRVYTPGKLRAAPPADIDASTALLTDAEHHANFESAAGFAFGITTAEESLLLRKTTPPDRGGFAHEGGAMFAGPDDPQYKAIVDWLAHRGVCP